MNTYEKNWKNKIKKKAKNDAALKHQKLNGYDTWENDEYSKKFEEWKRIVSQLQVVDAT